VTVNDVQPPTVACKDVEQRNDVGDCGAVVTFSATPSDNCDGATPMHATGLAPDSFFPVGTTTTWMSAIDAAGNTALSMLAIVFKLAFFADRCRCVGSCSLQVTVTDKEKPHFGDSCITHARVSIGPAGPCSANINYNVPVGEDNCNVVVTQQTGGLGSGALFTEEDTFERYVATDAGGLTGMLTALLSANKVSSSFV
jgi:hypothetical protein